jgi:hypothetical protein
MTPASAINRYLSVMRASAAWWTARAAAEARHFLETGEHQRLGEWVAEKDDADVTRRRLARYQAWLVAARRAGRYQGGTKLKRVLPDGTGVPWGSPALPEPRPTSGRLARSLAAFWRHLSGI